RPSHAGPSPRRSGAILSRTGDVALNHSPQKIVAALGLVVFISAACLAWFGYVAIVRWRESSTLLGERRAEESADRFMLALSRDMEGAQRSVLLTADPQQFA